MRCEANLGASRCHRRAPKHSEGVRRQCLQRVAWVVYNIAQRLASVLYNIAKWPKANASNESFLKELNQAKWTKDKTRSGLYLASYKQGEAVERQSLQRVSVPCFATKPKGL
jgi:hypothetical protein